MPNLSFGVIQWLRGHNLALFWLPTCLPTSKRKFCTLKVDKNRPFLTTCQPHLVHVFLNEPLLTWFINLWPNFWSINKRAALLGRYTNESTYDWNWIKEKCVRLKSRPCENFLADFTHGLESSAVHILYLMNYEHEKLLDNTNIYIKDT